MNIELLHGDCLDKLKELPDNSVDSVVTDPPYGLSFMGKKWDYDVPSEDIWRECLRVLKPGGHLLAFAGTRTQHRMAVRIEDAGFEIRDMIFWNYASGFPKSTNIYKQFQKMCKCGNMEAYDHERTTQESQHNLRPLQQSNIPPEVSTGTPSGEVLQSSLSEQSTHGTMQGKEPKESVEDGKEPSLEGRGDLQEAQGQLQGGEIRSLSASVPSDGEKRRVCDGAPASGSAAPQFDTDENPGGASHRPQPSEQFTGEPCAFCKQYGAQEVRRRASEIHGFGSALKPACEPITVARKPLSEKNLAENVLTYGTGGINIDGCRVATTDKYSYPNGAGGNSFSVGEEPDGKRTEPVESNSLGRFPANLIHDGSEEVVGLFPETKSGKKIGAHDGFGRNGIYGKAGPVETYTWGDSGSAARFFYCAKASKKDRDEGMEGFDRRSAGEVTGGREEGSAGLNSPRAGAGRTGGSKNFHPTVKPTDLMRYLCRLVTPPNGIVLDPFMGSGSTGKAAVKEGFSFIGIEREVEYIEIARARINYEKNSISP